MIDETQLFEDEYEKQFFGFSSTEFCYDFKHFVHKKIEAALGEVESVIRTEIDDVLYDKESLKSRIAMLQNIYIDAAKVPIEKFQNEIRKIFSIPQNVSLLPFQNRSCNEDLMNIKKEVAELENELLREQVFIAKLNQYKEVIHAMNQTASSCISNLELCAKKSRLQNDELMKERQNALENHYLRTQQCYFGNDEEGSNHKFQEINNIWQSAPMVPGATFFDKLSA